MRRSALLLLLAAVCCTLSWALGRRPDEAADKFPDYNRIDMHPKSREGQAPPPAVSDKPAASVPFAPPALNPPMNIPSDEDTPKPPPKVVPVPDDSSEPPMPDSIKDTLVQPTTGQN